ncbi:hypothetical protein QTP70_013629 [Hemibagrus guttatus]|uniref:Uncharacterized protein n=1 Tax=Hemibagrus guttatus TaxID=175788 RepID=A0AAE0RKC3_9TELE|nr:hypothetical protein QTP70_013629 [Hemibagrus guttatus]
MDYLITETNPAEEGSFPQLDIAPDLDGSEDPLLECWGVREMDFGEKLFFMLLFTAAVPVPSPEKWEGCVRKGIRRKTFAKLLCGPVGPLWRPRTGSSRKQC